MEPEAVRIFRENWAVYRQIVEADFMAHNAIESAVLDLLRERGSTGCWLDLGCGDAEMATRWLQQVSATTYCGVDLSGMALEEARARLPQTLEEITLVEADIATYLDQTTLAFDTMVAGFSLHHLDTETKRICIRQCRNHLSPDGQMILYDIVCHPGESREAYFERYFDWMRRTWPGLSEPQWTMVTEHISQRDYPESPETWMQFAQKAGFADVRQVATCAEGFHRVFVFEELHHS